MALATHSKEAKIRDGLNELGCAEHNFSEIVGITRQRLAQALAGKKHFSDSDAERILKVLSELRELAHLSPTPPDWKRTAEIRATLDAHRQLKQLKKEEGVFVVLELAYGTETGR